ncbi:MAG: hypothetical protein IJS53_00090 [Clostridia bacterium]|nr:hypothetical protein [Clostridia bacterium]
MKRLLSLCLFLAIALCCFSAVADAPVISDAQLTNEDHWNAPYDHSVWKRILTFELNTDAVLTAVIMDADSGEVFSDTRISNNGPVANQLPVSAGTISLYWPAVNAEGWHPDEGVMGNYTIDITVENDDGSDNKTIARSLIFSHSITDHVQAGYLHNNIRSFGPRFCDVAPEITDKWFRFTLLI